MKQKLFGSIDLSKAKAAGQIKKIGDNLYLTIEVVEKNKPDTFTGNDGKERTYTHFVSCQPFKQEERKEGVDYYIGNLQTREQQASIAAAEPTAEEVAAAPAVEADEDLPF